MVVGVGNEFLRDDAAGIVAAIRIRELAGDQLDVVIDRSGGSGLPGLWTARAQVVIIDAMSSGEPAGTVLRFDLRRSAPAAAGFRSSTHTLGLLDAVNLDRVLGQLPCNVVAFGVEGKEFTPGTGLSPEVAGAVENVVAGVQRECGAQRHRE